MVIENFAFFLSIQYSRKLKHTYIPHFLNHTIKKINVLYMDVCLRDVRKSWSYKKYRKYVRPYCKDTRRRRCSRFVYFDLSFSFPREGSLFSQHRLVPIYRSARALTFDLPSTVYVLSDYTYTCVRTSMYLRE